MVIVSNRVGPTEFCRSFCATEMNISRVPSHVVFVGNIPYDYSEQQVIDIFKEVGTVKDFRLVFDRETYVLKVALTIGANQKALAFVLFQILKPHLVLFVT